MRLLRAATARWQLARRLVCVALPACGLACGLACGERAPQPEATARPPRPRGVAQVAAEPPTPEEQAQLLAQQARAAAPPSAPTAPTDQPATAEAKPAEAEKPERDFGAELAAAVGSPAACLKARPAEGAPATINISFEAVLTETGIVTRGGARSGELDREELACLNRRVSAVRLAGPIEGAPRTVTTSVALTRQAAPAPLPGGAGGAASSAPSAAPGGAPGMAPTAPPPTAGY